MRWWLLTPEVTQSTVEKLSHETQKIHSTLSNLRWQNNDSLVVVDYERDLLLLNSKMVSIYLFLFLFLKVYLEIYLKDLTPESGAGMLTSLDVHVRRMYIINKTLKKVYT